MNEIPDVLLQDIPARTATPEQLAVINSDLKPGECLKVIAYAGTGKTTTFVDYADAHPSDDMLYLAFNKSVETEAKRKFGQNVVPKTVHALAYAARGRKYKQIAGSLRSWEIAKLLRMNLYESSIVRVSLDNYLNSADAKPTEDHIAEDELNQLKPGYEDNVINAIELLYNAMLEQKIPMTHNGYLKEYQLAKPQLRWPTILLDEAQDTNPVTLALVTDQLQYGTKVILCGDPYQQIYSWRGAIDAMLKVDCPTLRLTKSFRFGDDVARVANRLLSGLLKESVPIVPTEQHEKEKPQCIICRTNAGLFVEAVRLVRLQTKFAVVGETRFLALLDDLQDIYNIWRGKAPKGRAFAYYKSFEEIKEKAQQTLDYELQIKAAIVEKHGNNIPKHCSMIRDMLISEQLADVIIVTGHQAKGLEWPKVTLSTDFPTLQDVNGKTKVVVDHADKNDENRIAKEEINLLYVACTRAKNILWPGSSIERFVNENV